MVVIKNGKRIILKKMEDFSENLEEDLEFARRTEEAWKQVESGEYTPYSVEDFLKEIKNDKRSKGDR